MWIYHYTRDIKFGLQLHNLICDISTFKIKLKIVYVFGLLVTYHVYVLYIEGVW